MTITPKVSILIVSFNAGEYIRNTLMSVLDQSFKDFEVLILDNASSDNTKEYIRSFDDSRITLFEGEENVGPYAGLNYLLERAKGEYIAIQDHDDIWHPEKLSGQIDFLDKNTEYVGCACTMVMYYEADKKYFEYFLGEITNYALHPSVVYRNRPNLRYDTSIVYMADAYFLKEILCQGKKCIFNLRDPLALHVVKGEQGNYSYRWYTFSWKNIERVYILHSPGYATLTIGWEIIRKVVYPILNLVGAFSLIARIERVPFWMFGYKIHTPSEEISNPMIQKLFTYVLVR